MNTFNQEQANKSARNANRFTEIRPGHGIIDEVEKTLSHNGDRFTEIRAGHGIIDEVEKTLSHNAEMSES